MVRLVAFVNEDKDYEDQTVLNDEKDDKENYINCFTVGGKITMNDAPSRREDNFYPSWQERTY